MKRMCIMTYKDPSFMLRSCMTSQNPTFVLCSVLEHVLCCRSICVPCRSVHAHIMLWVHPDDVDRVAREISATIPAMPVPGKEHLPVRAVAAAA